jgi:hypothetical protein
VLHTADGRGDTRWRPEFHYDVSPPDHGWTLPVLVTPNIAADRERHVLELYVQWNTRKPEPPGVPLRAIEVLEIDVPAHWGTVEYMSPLGDERRIGQPVPDEHDGVGRRKLTWRKVRYPTGGDRHRERFAARFSDAIDLDHELTGRIEARFEGAVSGVTRIGLYKTDGAQVKGVDGARRPQTIVEVNFGLCLKGLRYQQQRVVPDRSRAEDVHRQETHRFPGVPPDHRTVALLTNTLADEGYCFIRVLENPAQPSPRSGAVNRLWDLLGRYYEGVYPIEFHLVLSGEEIRKGQDVTGDTSILLIVSGSYANEEMEQRVVEEWTRLWKRIRLSPARGRRRAALNGPAAGLAEQRAGPAPQRHGDGDRAVERRRRLGPDGPRPVERGRGAPDARVRPGWGVSHVDVTMWECGDCGQPETSGRKLDAVCHHCGVLLCQECRIVLVDGAFGGALVAADRTAVHCRSCRREHRLVAVPLGTST